MATQGRVLVLTKRYLRRAFALGVRRGTEESRDVGRLLAALANADELPGLGDVEGLIPPTSSAYVRRVPGHALWIWYRVVAERVEIVAITSEPPPA